MSAFADRYARENGPLSWNAGDRFETTIATACLDGIWRSTGRRLAGDPPLPRGWPEEAVEPLHEWNNTLNGEDADFDSGSILAVEGREYRNDTPRPGYKPCAYPHPLIGFFDRETGSSPAGRP